MIGEFSKTKLVNFFPIKSMIFWSIFKNWIVELLQNKFVNSLNKMNRFLKQN